MPRIDPGSRPVLPPDFITAYVFKAASYKEYIVKVITCIVNRIANQ
jgi:hypothetical protein